jgi:hypothetical protein
VRAVIGREVYMTSTNWSQTLSVHYVTRIIVRAIMCSYVRVYVMLPCLVLFVCLYVVAVYCVEFQDIVLPRLFSPYRVYRMISWASSIKSVGLSECGAYVLVTVGSAFRRSVACCDNCSGLFSRSPSLLHCAMPVQNKNLLTLTEIATCRFHPVFSLLF